MYRHSEMQVTEMQLIFPMSYNTVKTTLTQNKVDCVFTLVPPNNSQGALQDPPGGGSWKGPIHATGCHGNTEKANFEADRHEPSNAMKHAASKKDVQIYKLWRRHWGCTYSSHLSKRSNGKQLQLPVTQAPPQSYQLPTKRRQIIQTKTHCKKRANHWYVSAMLNYGKRRPSIKSAPTNTLAVGARQPSNSVHSKK